MLSLSGLGVVPTPYKCSSTICYGTDGGATHALFKETQYQMNRLGRGLFGSAWKSIAVDGFIGRATAAAANLAFPKRQALVRYANPTSFTQLAGWISTDRTTFLPTLTNAANAALGAGEAPVKIEARVDAFSKEGPAQTSSASAQPGVATPTPGITIPAPDIAIPGSGTHMSPAPAAPPPPPPPAKKGNAIVWGVAVVAVVGLVGAAAYAAKRRRGR
jgi:hypothetical protein